MTDRSSALPWIFIDGASQRIFRIRRANPAWEATEEGALELARCSFYIDSDDGTSFDFLLQISGNVLKNHSVCDAVQLADLLASKGVEIIEGAIHRGIRGDQQLVWEPDGVSLIG